MEARARMLGHAIHPMLIVFPLGLLNTAVVFDVLHFATDDTRYATASSFLIAAGIVGGAAAGLFGFVDWLAVPRDTRARRIGALHGLGNVVVLALFAASWLVRLAGDELRPSATAFVLGLAAAAVALVTAWMGGELVERLGVSVTPGANPDAPSSLAEPDLELPGVDRTAGARS